MENHEDEDFTHDVFLSFRGRTRYSFTDHLYRSLLRHGINVFRDNPNLNIGDEIRLSLLQAIEASRISIVVLCKDYASSTWCLDELVKIVDCYYEMKGKTVFVIFYKVEASDVRHQRKSYEIAMIQHEKRFGKESEKVKKWRSALKRVCALSGLYYKDDIYESEFIEKIVRDISAKLPPTPLQIKHLVGLDSRFEQVKSLINIDSDVVCMLGIYGAGGIGKTTFALDIYNKIRRRFEAACFLGNVREKSNENTRGLEDLQRTLLSEMGEETQTMMGSTYRGSSEIKRRLARKRVLLILDDVDSVKQLKSLAGGHDWFGSGSRIIVTTRDIDVLHKHDVKIKTYKLEELNNHESIELFCMYAFNMSRPAENFAKISTQAISYAQGIPLVLTVIGSNLKGKSIHEWHIELQKYRKVPDAEIQSVLEISYKGLSDLDQKVFLDIACFFKGERWDYVKRILDACGFYPVIRVFVSKCLLIVDENGCLEMHDLIQDMGREIIRKESTSNPGERSRLWSHKDALDVLKGNLGSTAVEGIMLHPPKQEKVDHWDDAAFKKMKNLRILIVRNTVFSSGPSYLPNSLRLLDWKCYPSKDFPPNFYPYKIVDFKLPHSSMILKKPFQIFEDLTFINLSYSQSITQIPNLSGATKLRVFTLDNCHKLVMFDKSVGFMPNLVYLSASGCTELKSFVPKMYLPSLQVISFNFCKKFEHFPHVIQKMDRPLKIHMINTAIKEIPKSIGNLTGLELMDMSICKGLKDLSSSFLLLPKLVTLKIDGCSQLRTSFQRFKERNSGANGYPNIETLHFSGANLSNDDVNAIIENFPKLEDLKVFHNWFVSLPNCIRGSLHLKSLDVSFCKNLTEIPELPLNIQKIDARYCQSLTSKASSILWSMVSQEIQRLQVVMPMPKREIPEWFDCVRTQGIPLLWARQKFPVAALALVFQEVKKTDNLSKLVGSTHLTTEVKDWHNVSLHLFIDGQQICGRDCRYFNIGPDHVLLCDLRVLFSDEEWQDLDANLGDDWKTIQVQHVSDLILTNWGVYVYKKETSMDDIQFIPPNHVSFSDMPSSCLVPKGSPEQQMKHLLQSFNPRNMFNEHFPLLESEGPVRPLKVVLRALRNAKAEIIEETSSSGYGESLKQDHEDSAEGVVQLLELIKENVPEHITDFCPEDLQIAGGLAERLLRARVELMKENSLDIRMAIILKNDDMLGAKHRRYWGFLEIKFGDPFYKPLLRRLCQLSWKHWESKESSRSNKRVTVVELKCQPPGTEEASTSSLEESWEEVNYNPELDELMSAIEQDAMSLNRTYGKMKASIVRTDRPISENHLSEGLFLKGQTIEGKLTTFRSLTKFKITPYGKMRAEDEF
ncbi:putative TIR domain, winged helix-turn-helix DNA-binding domain-containing protein [Medicago truncatula]|uniref:Disease resistance protein (TIR-NBS-LRR class), putative n=1 Tax=Medicago truncatula TaxID=3880 RepID=G7JDB8_MEDTR|nr:TMV resistance protein N [Medicago truncatula]AES87246.1 disease resistance protein (TIR-NBS-LRR class), putative [Medicago truncatula]RHN59195.1 putative TIR domain, winged helix-turn-helix DNA-binding domain-containing protein [Medicago truncatula]